MFTTTQRTGLRLLALSLGASISMAGVAAEPGVNAEEFSCAELQAKVSSAGRLSITGRKYEPNGTRSSSTNTFVSGRKSCVFANESPSQWKIYARDDEVCTTLDICLPRSMGR